MKKVLALCLVLLVTLLVAPVTWAKVSTEDISNWTKDRLQDYLDKYNIPYCKGSDTSSLSNTVKYYKDAVAANTGLFGDKVDHILAALKSDLEYRKDISHNHADSLISDIRHGLRQLELQDQLSREKVNRVLDRLQHAAVEQKIVTEAQWKEIANQVSASFPSQTLYQKVFRVSSAKDDASASINRWLDGVANRLLSKKEYTEQQVNGIIDQIRKSLQSSNINKWGDNRWAHQMKRYLKKQSNLTAEQRDALLNDIEREVNGYKIFAMDYVGQVADKAQHWSDHVSDKIKETGSYTAEQVSDWLDYFGEWIKQNWETYKAKGQANSEQVSSTLSNVQSQVNDMTDNWRQSFADFWKNSEHEAYRNLGYTEAQITWITKYLRKAFADQAALTHADIDKAMENVKHYLQVAQIQSQAQVQQQVDKLRHSFEMWRNRQR